MLETAMLAAVLLGVGVALRTRRRRRQRTISAWLDGTRPCAVRRTT